MAASNTNLIMNPKPKTKRGYRDMEDLSNLILLKHMCEKYQKKEEQLKNLGEKLIETQEGWNECNREKIEWENKYHESENEHKRREKGYQIQIKILTKKNQELTDKEKRKKSKIDRMKGSTETNRNRLKSWESTSTITSDIGIFTLGDYRK